MVVIATQSQQTDIMCPGLAHPVCFQSSVFRSTTNCYNLLTGDQFVTKFSKKLTYMGHKLNVKA